MARQDLFSELQTLLPALVQELDQHRRVPVATYRVQLHAGFTFAQVRDILPYLYALGISDCYTSPYLQARPGSTHGYDVVNPQVLNSDIGTDADYAAFTQALQHYGMGHLLDIVPNHMGVIGGDNPWWQDVLEHGPASHYARFFDINWHPPKATLDNKVLLPILGGPYGTVMADQELCLTYDAGKFALHYFEHRLPLAPCSTSGILHACVDDVQASLGASHHQTLELYSIITSLEGLPRHTEPDPERIARRYRETAVAKRRLATLYEACPALQAALTQTLRSLNGTKGQPESFDRLHALLEAQFYRLSDWHVATDELNYRRFFDIVHLAGVRVEDPVVFAATHRLIFQLLAQGKVTGLRIDHPDGLLDPTGYFCQLQRAYILHHSRRLLTARPETAASSEDMAEALTERFVTECTHVSQASPARPLYVVVEKILEAHEQLPEAWPVHGTTGYEFLNQLNGLFVDSSQAGAFADLYASFIGVRTTGADTLYAAKKLIMQTSLASELEALGRQLERLAEANRYWRDCTYRQIVEALREVIACFPVYRTYIRDDAAGVNPVDRAVIDTAMSQARLRDPSIDPTVFAMLHDILTLSSPEHSSAEARQAQRLWVQRFQQMTGPVMAKGLEDTTFYRYTPLASLNEVGGNPDQFGYSVQNFHQANVTRQQRWPGTLLASATHDTKRSEDVRARLNVLSEIPQHWHDCVWRWHHLNRLHKTEVAGQLVPSQQEEYLLYQTLLGAWPFEPPTAAELEPFSERIQAYMRKALREAKVQTNWLEPHEAYEEAVMRFVQILLDDTRSGPFLEDFLAVQQTIAQYGIWNSLAQTLLKMTAPGVPDCYQGCELWDLSLVDPDNRRPIDYAQRQRWLTELQQRCQETEQRELVRELLSTRHDGRIKLYLIWQTLTFRRAQAAVFLEGDYIPLQAVGSRRAHLCTFARRRHDTTVVVVVPRLLTDVLIEAQQAPLGQAIWNDTQVVLPEELAVPAWRQLFTGETITTGCSGGQVGLPLARALAEFPVALLYPVSIPAATASRRP